MPGRDGERFSSGISLQRTLRAALTERLGYKAAALFFAVVLWLVVSAEEPSEELVPVRLEAAFDSGRVMTSQRPVIRALVAGRARDLIKLYDTPPVVRRIITDDAPDSVGVDLRPTDVYLPPDVDAIVRDVQPRSVVLVFDVTSTRQLPVKNAVRVVADSGAPPGSAWVVRIEPEQVLVTGPRRVVEALTTVSTVDQTVTVRDSGRFLIPLDVKRIAGNVKVRPTEVTLSVVLRGAAPAGARDSVRATAQVPR
jgi:hypothetical protein